MRGNSSSSEIGARGAGWGPISIGMLFKDGSKSPVGEMQAEGWAGGTLGNPDPQIQMEEESGKSGRQPEAGSRAEMLVWRRAMMGCAKSSQGYSPGKWVTWKPGDGRLVLGMSTKGRKPQCRRGHPLSGCSHSVREQREKCLAGMWDGRRAFAGQ